jgi:acetyl esterase/lipase
MFTRKEVNPKQIKLLIADGFLPVSFDYRFCPELNILDGPMNDVCEALRWARFQLPSLASTIAPGLQADGEKVVAVGWSTGGHLALTLAFTAPQRGIRPPEAILALYCPTDYEDDCKCSYLLLSSPGLFTTSKNAHISNRVEISHLPGSLRVFSQRTLRPF